MSYQPDAHDEVWQRKQTFSGEVEIDGDLNHDGTNVGFYNTTPIPKQANTVSIETVLSALGLRAAGAATFTGTGLLDDTSTFIRDTADPTKRLNIDVAGTTNITGVLQSSFTTAKTVTLPDIAGTLASLAGTQTFTGAKTFSGGVTVDTANVTITDRDVVLSATTGTKFGTTTGEKLAFYGATPVVQPANTVSLEAVLSSLGLRASGSSAPLAIGNLTIADASNIILNTTTGTKIGTATTQKLGFFNATPVIKPAALTAADASTVDGTYGAEEAAVINNLRTRLNELESRLQALGLLT